jgi:purine-binding chemotaxis protein CheW
MSAEPSHVQTEQYLSFFVGGEEYAAPILEVRELIEYQSITKVPSMPSFVRGVANLRGAVVPVIDLARRFGFGDTAITKWTCIVMIEVTLDGEHTVVGLLADAVSQVVELRSDQIEPPPAFGTRAKSDFLKGVGKADQRFVLLLDVPRLLTAQDLVVQQPVTEAPAAGEPATAAEPAGPAPAAAPPEPEAAP